MIFSLDDVCHDRRTVMLPGVKLIIDIIAMNIEYRTAS